MRFIANGLNGLGVIETSNRPQKVGRRLWLPRSDIVPLRSPTSDTILDQENKHVIGSHWSRTDTFPSPSWLAESLNRTVGR